MKIEIVNCISCKNFFVTWDRKYPKGCRLFGFKSSRLPSALVMESTGAKCKNYEEKTKSK